MLYLSAEVTRFLHDTIVALMSSLHTCNFCVMMIWPVSIDLPSSFSSFGGRNSIRQNDVQIGMTIVRYQIRCLVSKNEAVIIVIEDECHATMFQCRSAQERFAHVHHVIRDLDQDSFFTIRHHVPVQHFLSVVLQYHVVRCHTIDICRTHHWKLRCKPRWADMSKTSRIDHQLVLLSFPLRLISPIHRVPTFLAVFQREYPASLTIVFR